jgi:hypothetical protein
MFQLNVLIYLKFMEDLAVRLDSLAGLAVLMPRTQMCDLGMSECAAARIRSVRA